MNLRERRKSDVELVWPGKFDDCLESAASDSTSIELIVQESFRGQPDNLLAQGDNLLVQGDNLSVLSALMDRFAGQVELIYIDPPFDAGASRSADVHVGDVTVEKLKSLAYRDKWGRALFLQMMSRRLTLLRELLSDRGTIYVHCDWRTSHWLRLLLDEIFGAENFRNEIIWCYRGGGVPRRDFAAKHDTILRYTKTDDYVFRVDPVRIPYSDDVAASLPSRYDKSYRTSRTYEGYRPNAQGKHPEDWWPIQPLMPSDKTERVGYPTQKPIELLQRIVEASSEPGALVMDVFSGSGTTLAAAQGLRVERRRRGGKEKLHYYFAAPRRWIGVDIGRLAIHATRKRLLTIQANSPDEVHFDICKARRLKTICDLSRIALEQFGAAVREHVNGGALLYGEKQGEPCFATQREELFSLQLARLAAEQASQSGQQRCWCLAWEFSMELRYALERLRQDANVDVRLVLAPEDLGQSATSSGTYWEAPEVEALLSHDQSKVSLVRYTANLILGPREVNRVVDESRAASGLTLVDYWAVDFDWRVGAPFRPDGRCYRQGRERLLETEAAAQASVPLRSNRQIGVMAVDSWGNEAFTIAKRPSSIA